MEHTKDNTSHFNATDDYLKRHYLGMTSDQLLGLPAEQQLLAIKLLVRAERESGREVARLTAYCSPRRFNPGMKDDYRRHSDRQIRARGLLDPMLKL
jgi:hypothetical protein